MKTTIQGIMVTLIFLAGVMLTSYSDNHYTRQGTVTDIQENVIEITDSNLLRDDYIWEWEIESDEEFHIGDNVKMKMFNSLTDNIIKDDEIISVKVIE